MTLQDLLLDPDFWVWLLAMAIVASVCMTIGWQVDRSRYIRRLENRGRAGHWQITPEIEIGKSDCFTFRSSRESERREPDIEFVGQPIWYSLHRPISNKLPAVGDILFELMEGDRRVGYVHARRKHISSQSLDLFGPIAEADIVEHLMKESHEPRTFVQKLGECRAYPVRVLRAPAPKDASAQTNALPAAIDWALRNADGLEFLQLWKDGHETRIRQHWPQVPDEVFGAPQFHKLQLITVGTGETST